jgi:serine/threonine-protein kinase HipA
MPTVRTYVFVYLAGEPVPAGLLAMADEPRNKFATFAYGRRYLARPDRIPVDPVALPLHDSGTEVTFQTEEGFAVFGGIRDAAPDGWGQYLMCKAMGDRLPSEVDLILASGDFRVGHLHSARRLSGPRASRRGAQAMRRESALPWKSWRKPPSARNTSMSSTRTCTAC